jgi:hypothetical protein
MEVRRHDRPAAPRCSAFAYRSSGKPCAPSRRRKSLPQPRVRGGLTAPPRRPKGRQGQRRPESRNAELCRWPGLPTDLEHSRTSGRPANRPRWRRDRYRREAAAPGQSRWEASDWSRETCSASATSISSVTPTSLLSADSGTAVLAARGGAVDGPGVRLLPSSRRPELA